jgi:hypothetical protein
MVICKLTVKAAPTSRQKENRLVVIHIETVVSSQAVGNIIFCFPIGFVLFFW